MATPVARAETESSPHALDPQDRGPQDACGVFGVWAPGEDVAKLTYFGLYALQHRGQESAGIAVSNGRQILVYKDMGLVSQVFDESTLELAQGPPRGRPRALLHHRRQHLAQRPADVPAHRRRLDRAGPQRQPDQHPRAAAAGRGPGPARSASSTLREGRRRASHQRHQPGHRAARAPPGHDAWRSAPSRCSPTLHGAFSLRLDGREHPVRRPRPAGHPAARARPARARLGGGLARPRPSTSSAPRFIREVEPGEMVAIDEDGLRSRRFAEAAPKGCLFEFVYLARPDTLIERPPGPQRPRRDRPPAGPRVPRRRRPGDAGAGVRHARRDRVRRGQRHPLRHRPGEELLRRPHLHPAQPDASASSASGSSSTRCAT